MNYDGGPDDAYVEGEEDEEIDWDEVSRLDEKFIAVMSIADPNKRIEAAKAVARELAGE